MEEENLPDYDTADYFPVDIGQVLNSRYQVLGKLGFGNNSTVWLSRDLQQVYYPNGEPTDFSRQNSYTALKVYTRSMEQEENREIGIYKKFEQLDSSHP